MLGVPSSPGVVGGAILVAGLVATVVVWLVLRRTGRLPSAMVERIYAAGLALALGLGPYLAWRIVEDVRYTTSLGAYERREAGPIQAFLQPYLLDGFAGRIPAGDTYATAVGDSVPYEPARKAFPALALRSLFPRRSVGPPAEADWLVAWGVDPRTIVPGANVVFTRPRSGVYPEVFLARVRP